MTDKEQIAREKRAPFFVEDRKIAVAVRRTPCRQPHPSSAEIERQDVIDRQFGRNNFHAPERRPHRGPK